MKINKCRRMTINVVVGIKCDHCGKQIPPAIGYWHVDPMNLDFCSKECIRPEIDTFLYTSGLESYSGNSMDMIIKHTYHHYGERKSNGSE